MKEFEFKIVPATDQTIEQIGKLPIHDRTAHAGNLSKTSQLLISVANAEILAFSGNQGSDPTYTPAFIESNGKPVKIAAANESQEKLTAFISLDHFALKEASLKFNLPSLRESTSLAQTHIAAAQELWGETKVRTYHSIFLTREGKDVLKALAEIPRACDRVLNRDGILETRDLKTVDPFDLINTMKSIAESSTPGRKINIVSGPVLSNEANIVALAFIRALPFLRDGNKVEIEIGHSSGPAMIRYSQKPDFQIEARRIAKALSEKLQLGGVSIVNLIYPASELKMSSPYSEVAKIAFEKFSALVDMILALQHKGETKNQRVKEVSKKYGLGIEDKERLITDAKRAINSLACILNQEFLKVPGLNFKPRQLTQWTMLENSRKPPIIPNAFRQLNIRQIIWFTHLAEQISNGNLDIPKVMPDELKPQ